MATTASFITCTLFEAVYSVAVTAGAADVDQQDILADMATVLTTAEQKAASPLYQLLNNAGVAYSSQAAARTAFNNSLRISWRPQAIALGAGGTGYLTPVIDANVSGAAVGNVRVDFSELKQTANNTGTYFAQIEFRHSIEQ